MRKAPAFLGSSLQRTCPVQMALHIAALLGTKGARDRHPSEAASDMVLIVRQHLAAQFDPCVEFDGGRSRDTYAYLIVVDVVLGEKVGERVSLTQALLAAGVKQRGYVGRFDQTRNIGRNGTQTALGACRGMPCRHELLETAKDIAPGYPAAKNEQSPESSCHVKSPDRHVTSKAHVVCIYDFLVMRPHESNSLSKRWISASTW